MNENQSDLADDFIRQTGITVEEENNTSYMHCEALFQHCGIKLH